MHLIVAERRSVLKDTVQSASFAGHTLNQHANGHARGKTVWVEENIGDHARFCKRHVLAGPQLTQNALLSVTRGKLVANNWPTANLQRHRDFGLVKQPDLQKREGKKE